MKRKTAVCQVCGHRKPLSELMQGALVRPELQGLVREKVPDWSDSGYICFTCLDELRDEYVRGLMEKDLGDLDSIEQEVVQSLKDNEILSENLNEEFDESLTLGQRIADKVAEFGGSWAFIGSFGAFMLLWVLLNSYLLFGHAFDPYPYILLNLCLSMLAAIQAPIIMMSQNRQEDRDRLRAENDYQVNLKAELEIRMIDEKLDHLMHNQWQSMLEIQQIQMEMIEDLHRKALSAPDLPD